MKISIIIPTFNGKDFLRECLGSVYRLNFPSYEVILVDNNSIDGSVDLVKKEFPQVKIIALNKNYGFARAVNEGIKLAASDRRQGTGENHYIALLNNDTRVDRNWLEELARAAEKNPEVSVFASNILSWDGEKIDSQGMKFFWKGKAEQINQNKRFDPNSKLQNPRSIFGACAAAALYKKDIFQKIGFFDEDFFAYLEDVDFSFRAQLAGGKCLFIPSAIVYHQGGATRKRMGNFKARMDAKNWTFLIIKNYPARYLSEYFFQIFVERLRNFNGLIKQTPLSQLPKSAFQTYGEVLIKLPKMIAKRGKIQKLRKVRNDYLDSIISLNP